VAPGVSRGEVKSLATCQMRRKRWHVQQALRTRMGVWLGLDTDAQPSRWVEAATGGTRRHTRLPHLRYQMTTVDPTSAPSVTCRGSSIGLDDPI
jgi:hypothetical protein